MSQRMVHTVDGWMVHHLIRHDFEGGPNDQIDLVIERLQDSATTLVAAGVLRAEIVVEVEGSTDPDVWPYVSVSGRRPATPGEIETVERDQRREDERMERDLRARLAAIEARKAARS